MMPTPVIDGIVRFLSEKSLKAYEIHFVRPSALSCFLTPVMNKLEVERGLVKIGKRGESRATSAQRALTHHCPCSFSLG